MSLKHVEEEDVSIIAGLNGIYHVVITKQPGIALFGPASQRDCERWIHSKITNGLAVSHIRFDTS